MWETEDAIFIEKWVNNHNSINYYTDVILIGGDGLFHQYINAIMNHHDYKLFLERLVTIIPCGSKNTIACDLNNLDPLNAL